MVPGPRLLVMVAVLLMAGLAASFAKGMEKWWVGSCVVVGFVAVVDAVLLVLGRRVTAERGEAGRMALGVEHEVPVTLRNAGRRGVRVRVIDGLPVGLPSGDWPWSGEVPGRGHVTVAARVRPVERGRLAVGRTRIEEESVMGLWRRRYEGGEEVEVRVFPNYEPVLRFALLAMQHRESQMGIVRRNRPGQSREFRQLRDYAEGDAMNAVDWKATARRGVMTSREYEEQRNQTVIMMADCGRRLRSLDGELSQFDHTLNAMLLLSSIALRQGDRVGVMTFGGDDRWLPPVSGLHGMPVILDHLSECRSTGAPGDFSEAVERLMQRQRRRSLAVFCTNLRSEDLEGVLRPLRLLRQRHLVVVASLTESEVLEQAGRAVETFGDALTCAATVQYLEERRLVTAALHREGILTIDAPAAELPVALGNLYLDIKKAGTL